MDEKPALTTHPLNDPVLSVRLRAISQIIGQPLVTSNRAALIEAADTIERLTKERDAALELLAIARDHIRDTAGEDALLELESR